MTDPAWWQGVGYAITGTLIPVTESAPQPPDAAAIVAWLSRHGVDSAAIAAERTHRLTARQPWPHSLPEQLRSGVGAAQLATLVEEVLSLTTGRQIPVVQRPRPGTLTPDEQRLVADKPPHHG